MMFAASKLRRLTQIFIIKLLSPINPDKVRLIILFVYSINQHTHDWHLQFIWLRLAAALGGELYVTYSCTAVRSTFSCLTRSLGCVSFWP
eukprot:COSAG01_NODE_9716_length_2363_cov_3.365283_1_plen_90_part_00